MVLIVCGRQADQDTICYRTQHAIYGPSDLHCATFFVLCGLFLVHASFPQLFRPVDSSCERATDGLASLSVLLARLCVCCQRPSPDCCLRWLCCIPLSLRVAAFLSVLWFGEPFFLLTAKQTKCCHGLFGVSFVSSMAAYSDCSPSLESLTFSSFISVVLEWFSCWNVVGSFSFRH